MDRLLGIAEPKQRLAVRDFDFGVSSLKQNHIVNVISFSRLLKDFKNEKIASLTNLVKISFSDFSDFV